MSSVLVISDVHHRFREAETWIQRLAGRHDRVVFLGDYFDSHGGDDGPEEIAATAAWLRDSLARPERTHLVGNHDLSYLVPGDFTACSGDSSEKRDALAPFLADPVLGALEPATMVNGWLLTHAGVHRQLIARIGADQVLPLIQDQWRNLLAAGTPPLFACGYSRGGSSPFGGITWQDFDEFRPTPGLHQIFAHTPANTVRVHWMIPDRRHILKRSHQLDRAPKEIVDRRAASSVNICTDTGLRSVVLIAPDRVTLFADTLPQGEQVIVQH